MIRSARSRAAGWGPGGGGGGGGVGDKDVLTAGEGALGGQRGHSLLARPLGKPRRRKGAGAYSGPTSRPQWADILGASLLTPMNIKDLAKRRPAGERGGVRWCRGRAEGRGLRHPGPHENLRGCFAGRPCRVKRLPWQCRHAGKCKRGASWSPIPRARTWAPPKSSRFLKRAPGAVEAGVSEETPQVLGPSGWGGGCLGLPHLSRPQQQPPGRRPSPNSVLPLLTQSRGLEPKCRPPCSPTTQGRPIPGLSQWDAIWELTESSRTPGEKVTQREGRKLFTSPDSGRGAGWT